LHDAWVFAGSLVNFHAPGRLDTWTQSLRAGDMLMGILTTVAAALIVLLPQNSMTLAKEFEPKLRTLVWAVSLTIVSLLFLNSVTAKDFLYIDF